MKTNRPVMHYKGTPIELSEPGVGFLGITYWALHFPDAVGNTAYRIFMYLGKVLDDTNTYAFIERQGAQVIFKTFDEMNTTLFHPFLLNIQKVEEAMEEYS